MKSLLRFCSDKILRFETLFPIVVYLFFVYSVYVDEDVPTENKISLCIVLGIIAFVFSIVLYKALSKTPCAK